MASWQNKMYPEGKFIDKAIITAAYQHIEESRHDRRFGNENINHRFEKVNVISLNADASKAFGKNILNYGAEIAYNNVESKAEQENIVTGETSSQSTRYPDGGSTMQSAAAYIAHTFKFNERLSVNEGIRFSNVMLDAEFISKEFYPFPYDKAEQNNNDVSGNLGLVYNPCNFFKTYLNLSKGFRSPNVDDLAKVFDSQPGSAIVPNPGITPEHTYNGELGFTALYKNIVQFDAAGYYTLFNDIIVTDYFTLNGSDSILYDGEMSRVLANVNKNEAYITGFHAAVTAYFGRFKVYSTINYTYARVKTDSTAFPLDHIPPLFGKTAITFAKKTFRAEVYSLYNARKPVKDYGLSGEDNEQYATPQGMPAWITINFKSSFHLTKYFELQAGVENILDRNYRVFSSGISAPGRNFILTLRLAI
jgi:hemoglobin/transferrin/lactoferrin receptor protein